MNAAGRIIAKNATFMMISQFLTWGLTLLLTIFMPRYLGAEAMGKMYLANSIWAIINIFAVFGMDMMITKVVARSPEKTPELFGTTLYLRTALFALGTVVLFVYANMVGYPESTRNVIYLIGIANFLSQFALACESILKGMERMEAVSIATVLSKLGQTVLVVAMILLKQNIYVIVLAFNIGVVLQLIYEYVAVRRLATLSLRFSWSMMVWMLKESFSYLMVRLALVMYQQVDVVIISLLINEKNIGWYGTAGQLFGSVLFVPTVFITVLYPTVTRLFASEPDSVSRIMRKSFDLMWVVAIPMGLGILLIADPLMLMLYGPDFAPAGPVLGIMGIVAIVTCQNMLLGQFLISIDRQKPWSWVIGICALLTIPLDIVLVPWSQAAFGIGALGGALSFLLTETIMTVAAFLLMPRETFTWTNLVRAMRVLAAGLVMLAAAWWTRGMFILIPVAIAAGVYLAAIVVFRALAREDWALLRSSVDIFIGKLRRRAAQPAGAGSKN